MLEMMWLWCSPHRYFPGSATPPTGGRGLLPAAGMGTPHKLQEMVGVPLLLLVGVITPPVAGQVTHRGAGRGCPCCYWKGQPLLELVQVPLLVAVG